MPTRVNILSNLVTLDGRRRCAWAESRRKRFSGLLFLHFTQFYAMRWASVGEISVMTQNDEVNWGSVTNRTARSMSSRWTSTSQDVDVLVVVAVD